MALPDWLKVNRKTFFNPSAWLDWNTLKNENKFIYGVLKDEFTIEKPVREETFEQAMERLNLTEDDVIQGAKRYRNYAILFTIIGFLLFFYAFSLLFMQIYTGFILGIAVSALSFSQAFRFDFWSYQMRQRRLGVTLDEWKRNLLGEKGNAK